MTRIRGTNSNESILSILCRSNIRTIISIIACLGFLGIVVLQRVLYYPESSSVATDEKSKVSLIDKSAKIEQKINKASSKKNRIETIALLGERNSGTTWMYKELNRCFNDTSLTIRNSLTRHKHYFQYDDGRKDVKNTLVVSEFRHPYTWILGMMAKSRHTPAHRYLTWHEYVTKPWTMEREASDKQYENSSEPVCKGNFRYHEVICCNPDPPKDEYLVKKRTGIIEQETPFYEMNIDGSGLPYKNVLEMRYDKIINHVQTVLTFPFVSDVLIIRYEDLIKYGTEDIIGKVEGATGIKSHCIPTPPQANRSTRVVEEDFKEWMDANVNWNIEKLIGYTPL